MVRVMSRTRNRTYTRQRFVTHAELFNVHSTVLSMAECPQRRHDSVQSAASSESEGSRFALTGLMSEVEIKMWCFAGEPMVKQSAALRRVAARPRLDATRRRLHLFRCHIGSATVRYCRHGASFPVALLPVAGASTGEAPALLSLLDQKSRWRDAD